MSKANAAIAVGVGLLVFGLAGYRVGTFGRAGWSMDYQIVMALGAMLAVGGWLSTRPGNGNKR